MTAKNGFVCFLFLMTLAAAGGFACGNDGSSNDELPFEPAGPGVVPDPPFDAATYFEGDVPDFPEQACGQ
jgi:hypothetical protein